MSSAMYGYPFRIHTNTITTPTRLNNTYKETMRICDCCMVPAARYIYFFSCLKPIFVMKNLGYNEFVLDELKSLPTGVLLFTIDAGQWQTKGKIINQ